MVAVEPTRALVLRSVDYAEADRIVTLLTERRGKLSLMARGARSSRRRFAGALEPFSVLMVEMAEGRGELGRLSAARIDRAFVRLLGRLEHMQQAGLALEALRDLLPDRQPEPELFSATVSFLSALDEPGCAQPVQLKLAFLARSMSLLGYAPELRACGRCGRQPTPRQSVQLDPARGQLVCRACGGAPLSLAARTRALLIALGGEGFLIAADPPWPEQQRQQVTHALKRLWEYCLGREALQI